MPEKDSPDIPSLPASRHSQPNDIWHNTSSHKDRLHTQPRHKMNHLYEKYSKNMRGITRHCSQSARSPAHSPVPFPLFVFLHPSLLPRFPPLADFYVGLHSAERHSKRQWKSRICVILKDRTDQFNSAAQAILQQLHRLMSAYKHLSDNQARFINFIGSPLCYL